MRQEQGAMVTGTLNAALSLALALIVREMILGEVATETFNLKYRISLLSFPF